MQDGRTIRMLMLKVTTVIPVHNREMFIARAIESANSQTYPTTEIIVVDDASTDATPRIVENLAKHLKNLVFIRSPENVGAAKARNIGAEIARGDLLAFLDFDDLWCPEKLEKQINEFEKLRDTLLSFAVLWPLRMASHLDIFPHPTYHC